MGKDKGGIETIRAEGACDGQLSVEENKDNIINKLDVVSIRLVKDAEIFSDREIHSPLDAVDLIGEKMCEFDREVLCTISLKSSGVPINCNFTSVGTVNSAQFAPREIFKAAILSNASAILMIHNHPSGKLNPSVEDVKVTAMLIELCDMMGIELQDHIIVGGDNSQYFSFREKGIFTAKGRKFETDYHYLNFPIQKAEMGYVADDMKGKHY